MIRHGFLAALLIAFVTAAAQAQTPWTFRWEKGQVITTKVDHVTAVTETIQGKALDITSKLQIVKRWKVLDVDAQGAATLEQSITSLRNEQSRTNGGTLLFDSANPEKSTPELKEMMKFINVPVATIKVDRFGRAIEVKSGPGQKYDAEPPFGFVLPGQAVAVGQAWVRPHTITLDPPLGAGEKYKGEQTAKLTKFESGKAIIDVAVTIKDLPEAANDQIPLLQKQLAGQLIFDAVRGRVDSVRLSVDKTVQNHQGAGSSYRFASTYIEQLVQPSEITPTGGIR
jgi:hypothetical protein